MTVIPWKTNEDPVLKATSLDNVSTKARIVADLDPQGEFLEPIVVPCSQLRPTLKGE